VKPTQSQICAYKSVLENQSADKYTGKASESVLGIFKHSPYNSKASITKLKKISNHPDLLLDTPQHFDEQSSSKLIFLMQLLRNLKNTSDKIVIVSSWTQVIYILGHRKEKDT
jgi:SNF2 family DNA or RNA helicase